MKLSVIIPTFNRAVMLREAVQSALTQTHRPIEIVVADDASNDDTLGVCEQFQQQAQKLGIEFHVTRSETNLGAPVARNRGFRQSSGDIVLFLDSDDVFEPDIFLEIARAFEDPTVDFVFGKVRLVDEELRPLADPLIGAPYELTGRDIGGYHWHTLGAAYRREFLEKVGPWDETLSGSQDWEFQARAKLSGGEWRFLDTLFGSWRQHSGLRVGVGFKHFRPDYVLSVRLACQRIYDASVRHGRADDGLTSLLARKLIIHAVELGKHHYGNERELFLKEASQMAPAKSGTRLLARALLVAPRFLDGFFLSASQFALNFRARWT